MFRNASIYLILSLCMCITSQAKEHLVGSNGSGVNVDSYISADMDTGRAILVGISGNIPELRVTDVKNNKVLYRFRSDTYDPEPWVKYDRESKIFFTSGMKADGVCSDFTTLRIDNDKVYFKNICLADVDKTRKVFSALVLDDGYIISSSRRSQYGYIGEITKVDKDGVVVNRYEMDSLLPTYRLYRMGNGLFVDSGLKDISYLKDGKFVSVKLDVSVNTYLCIDECDLFIAYKNVGYQSSAPYIYFCNIRSFKCRIEIDLNDQISKVTHIRDGIFAILTKSGSISIYKLWNGKFVLSEVELMGAKDIYSDENNDVVYIRLGNQIKEFRLNE